jgi:hypothetical protein
MRSIQFPYFVNFHQFLPKIITLQKPSAFLQPSLLTERIVNMNFDL